MRTLYIDASTPTLYLGAFEGPAWLKLLRHANGIGALESLFSLAGELFEAYPLDGFRHLLLNIGPGRLLSLRIAATAANLWGTSLKKHTVNSLALLSAHMGKPTCYELRANTFGVWNGGAVEITQTPPPTAPVLASAVNHTHPVHPAYAAAVEALPSLAPTITVTTNFFDPPIFAPIAYVSSTATTLSKDSR